ncbi:MAG: hypothetical protein WC998_09530 [Candidatus Paceibacterota bacterium]|jgi:hypothetical protein
MNKIVIVVDGGVVVNVYSNDADVDCTILDCDNMKERDGFTDDTIDGIITNEVRELFEVRY